MLRSQFLKNTRRAVRYNSNNAYLAKATSLASTISSKSVGEYPDIRSLDAPADWYIELVKTTTYWSKVGLEVAKQVYVKEGFSFPATSEFQNVFKSLKDKSVSAVKRWSDEPHLLIDSIKAINCGHVIKYGSYGVQLAGLFALGEIIGRRKVVGYPHH